MFQTLFLPTLVLLSLSAQRRIQAFNIINMISDSSNTHQNITLTAVLQKSAEVCQAVVSKQGRYFVQPKSLTAESVADACLSPAAAATLKAAISDIKNRNARVDINHFKDPYYHFDDETFVEGRSIITQGVSVVKASLKLKNYESARERLGDVLHTLQDFYSHSNWIELGNRSPYPNLINPNLPLENLADKSMPTCRSCINDDDCTNNILDTVTSQKLLISGYSSGLSASKPAGKCSHGGFVDLTRLIEPTGGINKDTPKSPHGYLHLVAADVATAATRNLLEDIRKSTNDTEFLRLLGISSTFSVLCIVIDTSESMADEIAEVKRVTSFIIDSRRGTTDEPSVYILVPFNDPGFGPVIKTSDPETFKSKISALSVGGGGDDPEMSLSGLWLALASTPAASNIFLFTDAEPKDAEMKSTVLALIESTKSTVNFMLTNPLSNTTRSLSNPINQLYEDLALASGGQAIEVSKELLSNVTSLITNSTISSLVTIFQAVRDPGRSEVFSFVVDSTVGNLTFYITGNSTQFSITAPSGQSQSSLQSAGSLGIIQTVFNLHTVRISSSSPAGQWSISISSAQPYTLKVTGKSPINFKYDFVEVVQNPQLGYAVYKSRPPAGGNVTLLVSLLGSGSGSISEVTLVEVSGSAVYKGSLEDQGSGDYLVTVSTAPKGDFFIRVIGQFNSSSSSQFQRQSSTRYKTSGISVTAVRNGTWFAGQNFSLPFTVVTNSSLRNFSITARNSAQYNMTFPSSLTAGGDSTANGTVKLSAPANATAGTEVILTIEVTQPGSNDTNYAFLRLAVSGAVAPPAGLVLSLWISVLTLLISLLNNQ